MGKCNFAGGCGPKCNWTRMPSLLPRGCHLQANPLQHSHDMKPKKPIESLILNLRGQKVILDPDLAELYGVATKVFNQAVKRNADRFPDDFRFQLTMAEAAEALRSRSQTVTASSDAGTHAVTNCDRIQTKYSPCALRLHRARRDHGGDGAEQPGGRWDERVCGSGLHPERVDRGERADSEAALARNAYPDRKPEVQVCCPKCGGVQAARLGDRSVHCLSCEADFDPESGPARGAKADCPHCQHAFAIAPAVRAGGTPPAHRLYAKLVLNGSGEKQYLRATPEDFAANAAASARLAHNRDARSLLAASHGLGDGFESSEHDIRVHKAEL